MRQPVSKIKEIGFQLRAILQMNSRMLKFQVNTTIEYLEWEYQTETVNVCWKSQRFGLCLGIPAICLWLPLLGCKHGTKQSWTWEFAKNLLTDRDPTVYRAWILDLKFETRKLLLCQHWVVNYPLGEHPDILSRNFPGHEL